MVLQHHNYNISSALSEWKSSPSALLDSAGVPLKMRGIAPRISAVRTLAPGWSVSSVIFCERTCLHSYGESGLVLELQPQEYIVRVSGQGTWQITALCGE